MITSNAGGTSVELVPLVGACPLYWVAFGDQLVLGVGRGACRWELDGENDDADFVEAVVEAVTAGRVSEVFSRARSEVTVRLADGTEARTGAAEGLRGCVPVPRWTRRGPRVNYVAYG